MTAPGEVARRIRLGGEAFVTTTAAGGHVCLVRLVCRTAEEVAER